MTPNSSKGKAASARGSSKSSPKSSKAPSKSSKAPSKSSKAPSKSSKASARSPEKGDLTQIGASPQANEFLKELVVLKVVSEMMDGYRLAVAVAIAENMEPRRTEVKGRKTMYATGNLDPNGEMRTVVQECFPKWSHTPYRAIEDLADQGVKILREVCMEGSDFYYTPLLKKYPVAP